MRTVMRLLFFVALLWGFWWGARNLSYGGRTLWERLLEQKERAKSVVDRVEKELSRPREKSEDLHPEERQEVRDVIREKTAP